MNEDAPTQTLPAAGPLRAPELTGVGAGIIGAALVTAGVWGLHVLTPGGGAVGSVGWVVLLCLAFTALGKGITLLRRALAPVTAAALVPLASISAPVRATAGIVIGASGIWWVMRGHAASWWTHITGTGGATEWTLISQLVVVALIAVSGALLFGGAKTLATLIFANSGARERQHNLSQQQRWALFWSSHPGLGLTLLAGGVALVFLSGYVVPRVSGWLSGDDPMAALAAIAAILTVAFFANTWWWKALSGWWTWAHTHGSSGGGTSPLGQMQAGGAVIALIWFSAMGFGLASPADYTGPGAAPLARAACPPDCGGGGGLDGPPGGGSQFRPPDMPAQQPDYQGGINQAPLNQNSGISIYNENPAQGGGQQASQNMGPQMSGQRAAHGEPLPNYGPWQPDAQPPAQAPVQQAPAQPQQPPVQQAPQAPQQPAQAPQNPAGQQPPAQQAPEQPVQQAPQQPGTQQPQGQPGQQPGQPNQGQPGQQQPQKDPGLPNKDNSPMDPTDLASAATRRGSQQAGEQAAQQGTQQATQQAPKTPTQTQQAPQTTQQTQQTPTSTQQNQQTQQTPTSTQQNQQTPKEPKKIKGAPKQGAPEEKPWDITGELKPINKNFPDGSQKLGIEGRHGLQNKDPVSIGKATMGEYNFESTFQQKLGGEVEASAVLNPQSPQPVLPKAEAFAGYNLENKNLVSGPGVQGIITNTLKVGPSASTGATTGTPIGATTTFQNLGGGNFYVNLPLTTAWRQVEVGSTIQGVVNVPELIQGAFGPAGQWISSGIPSVFGP
ncbi:hypothetical protein [Mycobacteroides chelonae]|uniref:Transcription initiation factor TFIID, subunit TAF12 (Also component of histone acetyltransferase SAGA) n=1 Tax=Mycobacteroides chelonae TaxID=1774 RepID=A0AB73LMW5_MYCCH|nr:hypothetical protein [Mycobacteroides chelonae]OHT49374.1 hypothetical protein BKG62_17320 [Mycobacteroides chelonae]OHT59850.1 hypothetical protein BKG64_13480 [Mycobacteroides chelonae]OHT62028.1 hypothetical protein BKG65_15480 [Mycobacteroides chelonae]OHU45176.1 hypothetical protein BKG80_02550 [Mycobacteroides chelonae]OHU68184.1 hypothetical protein BKG87_16040 [Mycobacteroides chelonae]